MITEDDFNRISELKSDLYVLGNANKGGSSHYISPSSHRVGKNHGDIYDTIDDIFEALVSSRIKKLQKELDKYVETETGEK